MPPYPRQNYLDKIDAVCIPAAFLLALLSFFVGLFLGVYSLAVSSTESSNFYLVITPVLGIILGSAGYGISRIIISAWNKLTAIEKISYILIQIVAVLMILLGLRATFFGLFGSRLVLEQDFSGLKGALSGGFLLFFSQRVISLAFISQRDRL
ncbi:hypothetical protein VB780_13275 [Leptolyngbya sp. CCNP1308]|uniref:hypothetical protein n=1 Tax=Leptolyngbya sp. CCNP1308 TaxID=3110255 RepID=UPI002B1F15E4|nr:hypothetical protein [Leptolyngbya sp. CCNP1308]MEA5449550.1 hypothetical protein [Leptolyngbya sp. CCNP1308]